MKYIFKSNHKLYLLKTDEYTLLPRMNAIALEDGSFWKVSDFQYLEWYGLYTHSCQCTLLLNRSETVFFETAPESSKHKLQITYDRDDRWGTILMMDHTPKLIKLQRLIKKRLESYKLRRLHFAMVNHPRLGEEINKGSMLPDDIVRAIASQI
jgi:hypothetical protein